MFTSQFVPLKPEQENQRENFLNNSLSIPGIGNTKVLCPALALLNVITQL